MIERILLDVDGIVADFAGYALFQFRDILKERHGINDFSELDDKFPKGDWDIITQLGLTPAEFWSHIDNYAFWSGVPVYHGARAFVSSLNKLAPVSFCTSSSLAPDCAKAKIEWLHRCIGVNYPIYICYKGGKNAFAKPGQLLIDDYYKNTLAYQKAGGPAILMPRPWVPDEHLIADRDASWRQAEYDKWMNLVTRYMNHGSVK